MRKILLILFIFIGNYAFSQYDMLFDTVRFEAGGIIWRYESGDDTVFINNDTITPSLGINLVITGTPNQIAILNPSTVPSINVNLSPIIDGDQSLATVDAIYDFFISNSDNLVSVDAKNQSSVEFIMGSGDVIYASFAHNHPEIIELIYDKTDPLYDSITEHRVDLTAIYDSLAIHNDTLKKHRIDIDALEASSHDAVTMSGIYNYITLSGQDIIRGQVDYDTDISNTPTIPTVNDPTITIQGTAVVSSPETFTLNQAGAKTITINDTQAAAQTLSTDNTAGDISISGGNNITLNVNDADFDPTNEIQDISGIVDNAADIVSLNDSITAHRTDINTNTTDITTNKGDIIDIYDSLGVHLDTLQIHRTDINAIVSASGSYVPNTRTLTLGRDGTSPITINGAQIDVTYDLSANRTWTVGHSTISASPILDSNPDTVVTYLSFDGFGHVNQYKFAAIYLDSLVPYNGAINHLDMGAFDITATEIHATTVNTTDLWLSGAFYDKDDDVGTSGQILSSTVTGTDWITASTGAEEINDLTDGLTTGFSVYLGTSAGGNDDGSNNSNAGVGSHSLNDNTLGYYNATIGYNGLGNITSGYHNASIGFESGLYYGSSTGANLTANNSTFLGHNTRASANGISNETVVGANAIAQGVNSVTLGDDNVVGVYASEDAGAIVYSGGLGIGTTSPESTVDIKGSMGWGVDTGFGDNVIVGLEANESLPLISTSTGRVYYINTTATWTVSQNGGESGSNVVLNNASAATSVSLVAGYYMAFNNDTYWIIVGLRSY